MPTSNYVRSTNYSAQKYRTEKTDHGNGSVSYNHRVPDGVVVGFVTLEIDIDEIMDRLAKKALLSKSGRATAMSGLVKVTVNRKSRREVKSE